LLPCWPLVPNFAGSNPAEAVEFFGRKNPQHPFLRRESKAVCPMSQLCGMLKNPAITWKSDCQATFDRPFLAHNSFFSLIEVSHAVRYGPPLEINGGTKIGVREQTASKAEVRLAGSPPAPQIEKVVPPYLPIQYPRPEKNCKIKEINGS
jgi:hypothetical protein